ncbi:MAG: protein kinase [Gemmataceae bacterium]
MSVPLLTQPPSTALANPPSDCTLVRYVRGGDDAAAEELYRRYASRLRRIVAERCPAAFSSRFDPEDIVQSVFRSLYEGVRKKFYDIPKGGEIWGLLFVLAANKLRDQISFHQAERRTVHRTDTNVAGSLDDVLGADDTAAAALKLTVEEYLAGLVEADPRHRRPADERSLDRRDRVAHRPREAHRGARIASRAGPSRRLIQPPSGIAMVSLLDPVFDAARLDDFERRLQLNAHARFEDALPPEADPQYVALATELIRLDMEYAWGRGEPRAPEHYLSACPALAHSTASIEALAFEDYRLRRLAGQSVSPESYAKRFGISTCDWPVDPRVHDEDDADPLLDSPATSTPPPVRGVDALRTSVLAADSDAGNQELRRAEAATPGCVCGGFPVIGAHLSGFEILDELGRGTFGRVYLARQAGLAGRTVALKVARRLFTESQTLAQLQHTNIVPIHSMHDDGSMQAVCMPFLGRCTLLHVLAAVRKQDVFPTRGDELIGTLNKGRTATQDDAATHVLVGGKAATPTTLAEESRESIAARSWSKLAGMSYVDAVLWIGAQLAAGLAHAHERGILHRDLKPANVLLTDDGVPMLLDFSIAEDVKRRGESQDVLVGGTLPYMAPEQMAAYSGEARPIDGRADVFGLGAILFELLSGARPFPDRTGDENAAMEAMLADRRSGPPSVRALNLQVPPSVECIVRKCLEPDLKNRYSSAEELSADLRRHLRNEPLRHASEPSIRERFRKWVRRHPRLSSTSTVAAVSVVLLVALAGSLYAVRERSRTFEARVSLGEHDRDLKSIHEWLGDRNQSRESLDRGLQLCRAALARYDAPLEEAAPRSDSRLMRYLAAEDRSRVKEDLGEVFYFMSKSAAHRAEMSLAPGEREVHLKDAVRWNMLAETWGRDRIPRAVREQRADLCRLTGDEAAAREWRDQAAATPPGSPRDRYLLGYWHHHQGRFRQAAPELEAATAAAPGSFPAWFVRGSNHLAQQENDLAAMCLTACIALRPDFAPVWMNRGMALARLNKWELAQADYEAALRLTPDDPDLHVLCAGLDQARNQHARAVERFTAALASPRCPSRVWFHRAASRRVLGDAAGAEADEAQGLKAVPADEHSWVARAEVRALRGDVNGAVSDVEAALEANPRSLEALQMQAHLLSEKKHDAAGAVRVLNRAVELYPESVPLLAGRGVLRARAGDRAGGAIATPRTRYNATPAG